MNNNSIDQIESIISESRRLILIMCDDMDLEKDLIEKEVIRRSIIIEEEKLMSLISLHKELSEKNP